MHIHQSVPYVARTMPEIRHRRYWDGERPY